MEMAKNPNSAIEKESSSAEFRRSRPKFLDWRPPTEEERALEAKARKDAREGELQRVTELERLKREEKSGSRRR